MKAAKYNKDGNLTHSEDCKMKGGVKDPECPWCADLIRRKKVWDKKRSEKNERI